MEKWYVERCGGITVNGDWEASNSWTGWKRINDTLTYIVEISGRRCQGKCKPWRFTVTLSYNGIRYHVASSRKSCNSVRQACRLADALITPEVLHEFAAYVFGNAVVRVAVMREGESYLTSIGTPKWMSYPTGEYQYAMWGHDFLTGYIIRYRKLSRTWHGYCGGAAGSVFEHWLPKPSE